MGVLKFRLTSPELASRFPELRKAYVTGLDRTPSRLGVELRNDLMTCHRDSNESGRLFVPWPVEGAGTPIVGTATLAERPEPYNLAVELARGKLNEVRNQLAEWRQMGLRTPADLDRTISEAHRAFVRAATSGDDPEGSFAAAQASLAAIWEAGNLLMDTYTGQVLQTRLNTAKLPTALGCALDGDPKAAPWAASYNAAFNAVRVGSPWKVLAPAEGQYRWDDFDAQLAWARRHKLQVKAGPLLEFRPAALPDWIWLWEGDFDSILGLVVDLVRQAVQRYRGKVPVWNLVHRPASTDFLGLSEEEQIRIAAPRGAGRPPGRPRRAVHHRVRAPVGRMDGLQPVPARPAPPGRLPGPRRPRPGRHRAGDRAGVLGPRQPHPRPVRLLEAARPLLAAEPAFARRAGAPLVVGARPRADPSVRVEASQWPGPVGEMAQANWGAKWISLAVAKPFVRSVTWLQASDAAPHLFPHGGLFRANQAPKPLVGWLKAFRREILA